MKVNRRDFLKWAGLSAIGAVACNVIPEREISIESPVNLPEDLVTGQDNWYATLSQARPEREGIIVRVMEGRAKKVQGNPAYPTNQGKQSARAEAGLQSLYHPDRIAGPMLRLGPRGSGTFQEISWEEALLRYQAKLAELLDENDAGAMLMVTEPLRGHTGMVVDRFVDTFGGRRMAFEPVDQVVLREAIKRVFGQDTLPDFDIENSDYILSFGADFLSTWVAPVRYSRGYGEFRRTDTRERGRLTHVDPRYSMTAANADDWIPIAPGMEGVLALGIAYVIISEGLTDRGVANAMTGGGLSPLEAFRPERIVSGDDPNYIGIPESIRGETAEDFVARIAREFATRGRSLAIGGGEAGAHTNGLFNLSAIFALNYLVGSVGGAPGDGGVVFSPATPIDGLPISSPTASMAEWSPIIGELHTGRIKVLTVRGVNPVHGLPKASGFTEALREDLLLVSISNFLDDTTVMADIVLPEREPLEDWGDDIPEPGPGYQMLGIQQPVVNPLTDLDPRSFPDILLTVSQELGLDDGLPNTFRDVLREGAQKLFDTGKGSPQAAAFEEFWNKMLQQGGWWDEDSVSDATTPPPPNLGDLARSYTRPGFRSPAGDDGFYMVPFLSNSILDGRGAHLPWLQAAPDPLTTVTWATWVEINARQAKDMGLREGDIVAVESTNGSIEALVYPHPAMPPGVIGIPIGQGHTPGLQYATKDGGVRGSNPISILAPESDKETGALAWAATRVSVSGTGRNGRVPKFEGIVTAYPIGTKEEDIVHVTGDK